MHASRAFVRGVVACIIILSIFVRSGVATGRSDFDRQPKTTGLAQTTPEAPSATSKIYFPQVFKPVFVLPPSRVIIANHQAFDKCALPTVQQMQNWWDNSPYYVFNLYLGGVSFFCSYNQLNNAWMEAVARQGWSFILTWVGLQAPCYHYEHEMSGNTSTAYNQGRNEASSAAAAAALLGFLHEKIIYYDVESYSGADQACRDAVKSFIRGWVTRLHELGIKAGAYGTPCTSYISDWSILSPNPDDVWIAYWKLPAAYDPLASVWNSPCLSNSLWANHQRLRQYAGDHTETWGGLAMTIDSNVLDGEITGFPTLYAAQADSSTFTSETLASPQIRDLDLLSAGSGWALVENRLLWTRDGGQSWQEITPQMEAEAEILAVKFLDEHSGWLVWRMFGGEQPGILSLLRTQDGGASWETLQLPITGGEDALMIEAAYLDFINANTGWMVARLQSGSSFSRGLLWATQDGGNSWQERTLPLGEEVKFLDAKRGWVAGGPAGDELYRTADGGLTWLPQALEKSEASLPGSRLIGLPSFANEREGLLPVTMTGETGAANAAYASAFALYATHDGGESWRLESRQALEPGSQPGSPLPFSAMGNGRWWAGTPDSARLYTASVSSEQAALLMPAGLPEGVSALDFATDQAGWALIQEGTCQGYKAPAGQEAPPESEPFRCTLDSSLMMTSDGGMTWLEVSLP